MHITFFGTASMVPTSERNHTAIFVSHNAEHILVDCGEGTQRQFRHQNIPVPKITRIFITHWHGDHFFGLPGVMENLSKNNYNKTLHLYGPKGSRTIVDNIMDSLFIRNKISVDVHEITTDGTFLETRDVIASAMYLKHSIPCVGYTIKEQDTVKMRLDVLKKHKIPDGPLLGKLQRGEDITFNGNTITAKDATYQKQGKTLAIILDTLPTPACEKLAKDADALICESTYLDDKKDKAREHYHLTAAQAATIAKKARAKQLILTHYSQRYKDATPFKKEAQAIFKNTVVANDFSTFTV